MGTFYVRIQREYGNLAVQNMKEFANTNSRLANLINRRIFLLECKRNKIVPNFIEQTTKNFWHVPQRMTRRNIDTVQALTQQVTKKLHCVTIRETIDYIRRLQTNRSRLLNVLSNLIPRHILDDFLFMQQLSYNKLFNKVKIRNINKITNLKSKKKEPF